MGVGDASELLRQAQQLEAAGRTEEAVVFFQRYVTAMPASAVAEHNLASALGNVGRWVEAEGHIRQTFLKGGDAPESWLVLARCLQMLALLDEAELAFLAAILRRPLYYDALRELAQLRWMRTADAGLALACVDAALLASPAQIPLLVLKSQILRQTGRPEMALSILTPALLVAPVNVDVLVQAAQAAVECGRTDLALGFAERCVALAPDDILSGLTLVGACLAVGSVERAEALAGVLRGRAPDNQHAIALQATAWRLLGDNRYRDLFDYGALVHVALLDSPPGWSDLHAYLADLSPALNGVHQFRTHPFNQSVRHGSQTPDIHESTDAALRALPAALERPVADYLASLGPGSDPVRARNTGDFSFNGMWSVRLRAGGHLVNHVHPQGWVSSACYVETVEEEGMAGWLQFGQPGVATIPPLQAEHFVKPEPGSIVLFPSYMWHGTRQFSGGQSRLSFAFDLKPRARGRQTVTAPDLAKH